MSVRNFQLWITAIGIWVIATLLSLQLSVQTRSNDSDVFVFALGIATFVLIVVAVIHINREEGNREEDA